MRPILLARLDKTRPALVLTRETVRPYRRNVTLIPITSTIRGLSVEVSLDQANGLDHECVANCDSITTVPVDQLVSLTPIGYLLSAQESVLTAAILAAFDLDT